MINAEGARPLRIETHDPGVFRDLDAASRDAAIQSLKDTDAPVGLADELVAAITGPALKAVVAARVEQIAKHGYTAEDDAMLPIVFLPKRTLLMAQAAHDAVMVPDRTRDLAVVRRRLARVAALAMASIDRIDAATCRANEE